MKIRNLTEESTTTEDIVHINRNASIRKNDDRSYTRNAEPFKIQDIIVQTTAHLTTDMRVMKQITYIEMIPI